VGFFTIAAVFCTGAAVGFIGARRWDWALPFSVGAVGLGFAEYMLWRGAM